MSKRYEILEILAQDSHGVAFHATDRETNQEVVVRRFFPFGIDGGGLEENERVAYEVAVVRLIGVSHPALRKVLGGGVDPVDGMPYLVTEWVEGQPLSERLATRKLDASEMKNITELALECSLVLSETFQEEDVWIETRADSIVLNDSDPERAITFWISPLRWLGGNSGQHNLSPIVFMVTECTGWNRLNPPKKVDEKFRWWLRRIGSNPSVWSVSQAHENLKQGPTAEVLATPQLVAAQAPTSPVSLQGGLIPTPPPKANKWKVWVPITLVSLIVVAVGVGKIQRMNGLGDDNTTGNNSEPSSRELSAVERANARALELSKATNSPEAGTSKNCGLIAVVGEPITIEARIAKIQERKHWFLIFDQDDQTPVPRIRNRIRDSQFTLDELKALKGKVIRITGTVAKDQHGKLLIELLDRDQLEIISNQVSPRDPS